MEVLARPVCSSERGLRSQSAVGVRQGDRNTRMAPSPGGHPPDAGPDPAPTTTQVVLLKSQ